MRQPDMWQLGQRLMRARQRKGWNQSQCAREAGVHRATLARLEAGEKLHLRSDMLYTLASVLGVSADYLLGLADAADKEEPAHVA